MITCSENLSESTFAAEHQTTSQTPRQGWTDGRRAPPIQMRLTDRPSFPCTLVPGSFSNGFPHAKAPTHAKGENLVGERAAVGFRRVRALRAPWSCAAGSKCWLHVHSPALRQSEACV